MLLHRLNKGFAHKVFRETELNEFENGYRNENRKVKNDNISDEVITKKEKRMNTKYEILKNIFGYDTFGDHADRRRKIHLLSGPGADV